MCVYIYIYIYIYTRIHYAYYSRCLVTTSIPQYRNQVCIPLVSIWNLELFKAEKFQKCDDEVNGSYDSVNKYLENTTA